MRERTDRTSLGRSLGTASASRQARRGRLRWPRSGTPTTDPTVRARGSQCRRSAAGPLSLRRHSGSRRRTGHRRRGRHALRSGPRAAAAAQRIPRALIADTWVDPVPGRRRHHEIECARGSPGLEVGAKDIDLRLGRELSRATRTRWSPSVEGPPKLSPIPHRHIIERFAAPSRSLRSQHSRSSSWVWRNPRRRFHEPPATAPARSAGHLSAGPLA